MKNELFNKKNKNLKENSNRSKNETFVTNCIDFSSNGFDSWTIND